MNVLAPLARINVASWLCRVMPRKSELFAGSSVDLWRVVDFVSCATAQDNLTRIRNKACASV
jgi:hypothetical protein